MTFSRRFSPIFVDCVVKTNQGGKTTRRQTLRELHEFSTRFNGKKPYSELVMRGAFVVQLRKVTQGSQLEGVVEEVDTGKQARFLSESELIAFLREHFAQTRQSDQDKKGTNERKDSQ